MKDRNFFTELKQRNVYELAVSFMSCGKASPLFELARVLVRFDHVARFIVNANHSVVAAGPHKFSISSPVDEMSR